MLKSLRSAMKSTKTIKMTKMMTIWQTSCRMTAILMSKQQMRKTKKDLMQVVPMSLMTT